MNEPKKAAEKTAADIIKEVEALRKKAEDSRAKAAALNDEADEADRKADALRKDVLKALGFDAPAKVAKNGKIGRKRMTKPQAEGLEAAVLEKVKAGAGTVEALTSALDYAPQSAIEKTLAELAKAGKVKVDGKGKAATYSV